MSVTSEEIDAIRLANEQFYRALTNLNIEAMDTIWAHEGNVRCIHPGWEAIEGWDLIRQSWEAIFSNTASLIVEPSRVAVRVEGRIAWVSCLESITSGGAGGGVSLAHATNLFVRTAQGWKMILHHASQVPAGARRGLDEEDDGPVVH